MREKAKIVVVELDKSGKITKTTTLAKSGEVFVVTPATAYRVEIDGVPMTPKNAKFMKDKKGHLVVEQNGEAVVDFKYSDPDNDEEAAVVPVEQADGNICFKPVADDDDLAAIMDLPPTAAGPAVLSH